MPIAQFVSQEYCVEEQMYALPMEAGACGRFLQRFLLLFQYVP